MATWIEDVRQAFINLNGIADYKRIYEEVAKIRTEPLPESWQAIIRRTIETASSDSDAFDKKYDLFFSVEGIGKGIWGLREFVNKKIKYAYDINDETGNDTVREPTTVYRILRDTKIARGLKMLYDDRCQICSNQLQLYNETYSEAHHIKPLGTPHNGPDETKNLIVVCPNCHVQLDYGAIKIEKLNLNYHTISKEYIEYHNDQIYEGKRPTTAST